MITIAFYFENTIQSFIWILYKQAFPLLEECNSFLVYLYIKYLHEGDELSNLANNCIMSYSISWIKVANLK